MSNNKDINQGVNDKDQSVTEVNQEQTENQGNMKRRSFLGRVLAGSAAASIPGLGVFARKAEAAWSSNLYPKVNYGTEMEALVVGSGFGGAVTSCRMGKKWPGKVMIVERGKRYGQGDFARGGELLTKGFWNQSEEDVPRLLPTPQERGVFDFRNYDHMDIIQAAGWGGGSLLYANALIEPISPFYDEDWPAAVKYAQMKPYYDVHGTIMGARTAPTGPEPERAMADRINTSTLVAEGEGIPKHKLKIGVFFGNDPDNPTPMGQDEMNPHGAMQRSCTYCAECVMGCNEGAKTSLNYNYLHVAETKYNAVVKTEHKVDKIIPLNAWGLESIYADGSYGYNVYMVDMVAKKTLVVKTKRVILAAGALGSTEILLRNKQLHLSLSRISGQLGKGYSPNGDFFNFAVNPEQPVGADKGPTIIEYLDYQEKQDADRNGFIAEQMALPWKAVMELLDMIDPMDAMKNFKDKLAGVASDKILLQFTIGKDSSNGTMSLDPITQGLRINWPYYDNMTLLNRMIAAGQKAVTSIAATLGFPLPTWEIPFRRNLTVHPLGGCRMADSKYSGVVSGKRGELGKVFNYENLYVADGSIMPNALGVNPSITIGAMAEMIAEDITGIAPTVQL